MAGLFDFLGDAEQERAQALAEEDRRRFAEQFRAFQSRKAFQSAQRENRQMEQTAARLGVELPEENEQGFIGRTLDVLDTGGQLVRGVAAKFAGLPEFQDKGLIDAALLGDEKDLTVGDILRQKNILQGDDWGSAIGRFGAGFVGDVLTDPLTYASLGTSGIAKLGGAPIAKEAETLVHGAHQSYLTSLLKSAKDDIGRRVEQGLLDKDLAADAIAKATVEVERKAANPIRVLRAVAEKTRKAELLGAGDTEIGKVLLGDLAEQGRTALKQLGLAEDLSPQALFAKPAIRFSSAFPGLLSGHFNVPMVNARGAVDIPFVTDLSQKAFKELNGKFYGASVKVGEFLDKAILAGKTPEAKLWQRAGAWAAEYPRSIARGAAHAISRDARIGNALAKEDIDELLASRMAVVGNRMKQAEVLAKGLTPADMERASSVIEAGLRRNIGKDGFIATKSKDVVFEKGLFDQALSEAMKDLDALSPGKGARLAEVITQIRADFDRAAKEGLESGLLGHQTEGYVRRIIRGKPGSPISDTQVDNLIKRVTRGGKGWDFERSYITALEAKIKGHDVNTNLLDSWLERMTGHDFARAEKDFFDRIALETGLKGSTYKKLSAALAGENEKEFEAAYRQLKALGIKADPKTMQAALDAASGVTRHSIGEIMSPDSYDFLRTQILQGGVTPEQVAQYQALEQKLAATRKDYIAVRSASRIPGYPKKDLLATKKLKREEYQAIKREMVEMGLDQNAVKAYKEAASIKQAGKGGLKFTDEERQAIVDGYNKFNTAYSRILGREGENFFTRSGAEKLTPRTKAFFDKQVKRLSKEEYGDLVDFYSGALPHSVVRAIDEAYDTRSTLMKLADWAGDSPSRQAIQKLAGGYLKFMRVMKQGVTQLFPAYHTQNFSGAFIQASHGLPLLGSAMNPVNYIKNAELLRNPSATLVQANTGRVFTSREINNFLDAFKVRSTLGEYTDALSAHASVFDTIDSAKEASKQSKNILAKGWGKIRTFSELVENQGRQHTFIELLKQGNSPEDAARLTNQLLIDYSRAKTPFERDFLNNLLFFYSFPRFQTSNTLHALITRPGALTGQLHLVEGARDALTDAEELRDIPDIDNRMLSLRAKETFGRVIGKDAEGLPEVMSSIGVPVADLSRMMELRFPKEFTIGGLMEAGGESIQRTSQLMLAQSGPIVKMMAELISERNLFFDRPLSDKSLRRMPKFADAAARLAPYGYQKIPRAAGDLLDSVVWKWMNPVDNGDGTVTVDPVKYTIITNLVPPLARAANTVKATAKEGVPTSRKLTRLLFPLKVSSLDFEKSGVYDRNRQLESFFEKRALPTSKSQLRFYQRNNPTPDELEDEAIDAELGD